MAASYSSFPVWALSHLAVRDDGGEADRITFKGNHICRQMFLPVRAEEESAEAYTARCEDFRKRVPRGSDHPLWLAFAHEYYVRDRYSSRKAAYLVLKDLQKVVRIAAEEKSEYAKHGIRWRKIKPRIGTSKRGRRTTRKRRGFSKEDRQVETIHSQASRFKRKCENFDQQYEMWFGGWRAEFCRDQKWYAEAEAVCLLRLAASERDHGWDPSRPMTPISQGIDATNIVLINVLACARIYTEQGKHTEAEPLYRRALEVATKALGPLHPDVTRISQCGKP